MQKRQKILIGVAVGVAVLIVVGAIAAPRIYRDLIAAPAQDAPTIQAEEGLLSSGDPLDPDALLGDWRIGGGSEAGYRVDEVLNGTEVTVTGRTEQVSGTITIGGGANGLTLDSADFTVDVASIETDNGSRDAYFRDSAVGVAEHPTATFHVAEAVDLGETPLTGEVVTREVTGELTIAGVAQTVTATIEARSDGETAQLAGTIPIRFEDFGIDAPSLGFVEVEPEGFVEFQLTAVR